MMGIIPANTGRINLISKAFQQKRDHPREYGENRKHLPEIRDMVGSSPRIRGEWRCGILCRACGRIIPANTGRIGHRIADDNERQDHPREYGENGSDVTKELQAAGSSPRIRGECLESPPVEAIIGIIPANTGRMNNLIPPSINQRDHPREYGENPPRLQPSSLWLGSSPRIRGEYLLTLENPTSRTDFTSLSFSTSSSAHAGGFGPSSFHGSSSRGYWMPHQCESFHVGGFPLATMHSHNKTLLVFVCWVCHNRAP